MEEKIKKITDWLEARGNKELRISKEEDGDTDNVTLTFEKAVLAVRNETHPDDYVAEHSIILQGSGTIQSDKGDEPLPRNLYEIPFDESIDSHERDGGLHIHTDRAKYQLNWNN